MDTVTGNKLIAEFDAFDWDNFFVDEYGEFPSKIKGTELDLEYHTSWDWLMPVVEKVWSLGGWEYCIFANGCTINGDHEQPPYISHTEGDTITSTWKVVVEFINWLNQHPTNP